MRAQNRLTDWKDRNYCFNLKYIYKSKIVCYELSPMKWKFQSVKISCDCSTWCDFGNYSVHDFFRKRMEFYELVSRKEFLHVGNKRYIMLYSLVYIKEKRSHPFLFGKLNGFWMVVLRHIRNFSQKSASAIFCHIREDRPTESSALQHLQPCYNSAGYQRRGVEGNHWFKK